MKKALLVALCFIVVGLMMVNGTFAMPDLSKVFQKVDKLIGKAFPEAGETVVDVELISDDTPQSLFPGGTVSRDFHVENVGTGDVYFRLVFAVQYDEESWDHLNVSFTPGSGFIEEDCQRITIGKTPYIMKVFTYKQALTAGKCSSKVGISIAMDAGVTSEQISRYRSDFLQTQVLAIDPTPFLEKGYADAEAALNAALPLDKLNPF